MDIGYHSAADHTGQNGPAGNPVNLVPKRPIRQHINHSDSFARTKFSMDLSARLARISIKHNKPGTRQWVPNVKPRLGQRVTMEEYYSSSGVEQEQFTSVLHRMLERAQGEQVVFEKSDLSPHDPPHSPPVAKGDPKTPPTGRILEDHNQTDIGAAREAPVNNRASNTDNTEELNNIITGQQREKMLPTTASTANQKAPVTTPRKGIHTRSLPISRTAKKQPGESKMNNNKNQSQGHVNEHVRVTRAAVAKKHVRAISKRRTRATTLKQSLAAAPTTRVVTGGSDVTTKESMVNFSCNCGSDYIMLSRFLKHQESCKMGMKKIVV
ncbi:hypothetical protein DFP73DRAFT_620888 [Morchella snyderi]|nr:hypothetical protein DFP73DRAFT_620888 [Morchella snyderi]